jgi:hypothetical protein
MDLKKSVKGQSGPELMIVYAFVILSLGATFVLLYNMGVFSNLFDRVCGRDARAFSSLTPVDWGAYYLNNSFKASMRNDAGMTIEVTGGFVSLGSGLVNCTWPPPGLPRVFLGPGESYTFNLTCSPQIRTRLADGDCYAAGAVFNYTNVDNDRPWKSMGTFRGEIEKG